MHRISLVLATSGVLAAATCSPSTEPAALAVEERRLAPSAVNAGVSGWTDDHYPGATPPDRYHGFRHARDPFRSIAPNWLALGLAAFGPEQSVDEGDDFSGSHMLVTDALPATGSYAHAHPSVFADGATPLRADRSPVFAAAWRYLLGRP